MKSPRQNTGITPAQIKLIHTLKNARGMDDVTYRGAMWEAYGVDSSKDLNSSQAESVIRYFEKEAIELGVWQQRSREQKHKGLKGRAGYATPAQLSFIEGLWKNVSRGNTAQEKERGLRSFLSRQAGVSDLRFLKSADVDKVLCALKGMVRQKKKLRREEVTRQ